MKQPTTEWTKDEVGYLRSNHIDKTYDEMSEELNRTKANIKGRLQKLSLKKRPCYVTPKPDKIPEGLKGYLAGIIDGEGSVGIHKQFCKNNGKKFGPYYRPCIEIAMCYNLTDTTKKIQEILNNADFSMSYRKRNNENSRKMGAVYTHTTGVILALAVMLKPYSITKKKHLELIEEFCRSRLRNSFKPYTERELEIYGLLAKLNYRGGKVHTCNYKELMLD